MSFMNSLNSGISGLRAFQSQMDVIGNNIANVDTTGYKSSSVHFAEMLNQQLGGSNQGSASSPSSGNQVGLGVRIAAIERNFSQGSLQSTGRTTDLAIEGNGFFVVKEQNQNLLTRAGNFSFNKEGYLVDQSGNRVQGYEANSQGVIQSGGTTDDVRIDKNSVYPPQATTNVVLAGNLNADTSQNQVVQSTSGFTTTSGNPATSATDLNNLAQTNQSLVNGDTIQFDMTMNDGTTKTVTYTYNTGDTLGDLVNSLNTGIGSSEGSVSLTDGLLVLRSAKMGDSQLAINNVTVNGTGSIKFPSFTVSQKGNTGSKTVSSTVYDGLGRAHTLLVKFTQNDNNTWQYDASFADGETISSGQTGAVTFDESGNLSSANSQDISFDPGNGANPVSFKLNFGDQSNGTQITQYAGFDSTQVASQNGFAQGKLEDVKIDESGNVTGVYDNGENINLAQIALANVQNADGLESLGNGLYRATNSSGTMNFNTANNLSSTNVRSGALEGSNVDLAKEFTKMITSQRAYQSNARVITTADQLLQEAVNLKR